MGKACLWGWVGQNTPFRTCGGTTSRTSPFWFERAELGPTAVLGMGRDEGNDSG